MSGASLLLLVAMGVVAVIWSVLMFRMLWRLTRRSLSRLDQTGGGYGRWTGHSLSAFFTFFTSAEDRPERRRLVLVTGLLCAIIAVRAVLLTGG